MLKHIYGLKRAPIRKEIMDCPYKRESWAFAAQKKRDGTSFPWRSIFLGFVFYILLVFGISTNFKKRIATEPFYLKPQMR